MNNHKYEYSFISFTNILQFILLSFYNKVQPFFHLASSKIISRENQKKVTRMNLNLASKVEFNLSLKEEIQIIIYHWIRTFDIQLGWIKDFDKLVVNYVSSFASTFFMFDTFRSSSKLINTFTGHTKTVYSIDYSTFGDCPFICSGSQDKTVSVWDVDNNKQIQSFNEHSSFVYCVKFSSYHYHNHHQN
ncbi:beta subunit of coatomer complex, partial [Reticulomyxa filosa]